MGRIKRAPNRFPRPNMSKSILTYPEGDYIGIDEVGIGAIAGPIVFAAVAIEHDKVSGVRDSKKVAEDLRYELAKAIQDAAKVYKISRATHTTIDNLGYDAVWDKGVGIVLDEIRKECDWKAIIDGERLPSTGMDIEVLPKADVIVYQVSAASLVAKAHRDLIMVRYHNTYPQYGFDKHKGYGTKQHIQALQKYGPCEIHRKSLKIVQDPHRKKFGKEELEYTPEKADKCFKRLDRISLNPAASDWEKSFVEDIRVQHEKGKRLSARQMFFLSAIERRRGSR